MNRGRGQASPVPSPGDHPPQRARGGNESAQAAVRASQARHPLGLRRTGRGDQARSRVRGRGQGRAGRAQGGGEGQGPRPQGWGPGAAAEAGWRAGASRGRAGGRAPGARAARLPGGLGRRTGIGRGRRGPGRVGPRAAPRTLASRRPRRHQLPATLLLAWCHGKPGAAGRGGTSASARRAGSTAQPLSPWGRVVQGSWRQAEAPTGCGRLGGRALCRKGWSCGSAGAWRPPASVTRTRKCVLSETLMPARLGRSEGGSFIRD